MLPKVNLKLVTTEREKEELKAFGLTFDHELEDRHFSDDVFSILNDKGEIIGFFVIQKIKMALCGFHPDKMKPMEFVDSTIQLRNWDKIQSQIEGINVGVVGVDLSHKTFTPELMNKIGYNRVGLELYSPKER